MANLSKVVALVLEIQGQRVMAHPVPPEKLVELKQQNKSLAERLDECTCGEEYCLNGYIYVCAEGPNGRCQLFGTDWQCNDGS